MNNLTRCRTLLPVTCGQAVRTTWVLAILLGLTLAASPAAQAQSFATSTPRVRARARIREPSRSASTAPESS